METFDYSVREQLIIDSKESVPISYQEFLTLFNKVFLNDEYDNIIALQEHYPEYVEMYAEDKRNMEIGEDEDAYKHPILADTSHFTSGRVLDLIEYLLGNSFNKKREKYRGKLEKNIKFRTFYNFIHYREQKGYDPDSLWYTLFQKDPELQTRLNRLHIKSFHELVFRATEYYEMSGAR